MPFLKFFLLLKNNIDFKENGNIRLFKNEWRRKAVKNKYEK